MKRFITGLVLALLVLGVACGGNDSNGANGSSPSQTGGGNGATNGGNSTSCVASAQASSSVGKRVTVCGRVADASYRPDVSGRPTFLNFDRVFPNHTFTALVWGDNRAKFNPPPEQQYGVGKNVCVTGLVENYQGKPEIVVSDPSQIRTC